MGFFVSPEATRLGKDGRYYLVTFPEAFKTEQNKELEGKINKIAQNQIENSQVVEIRADDEEPNNGFAKEKQHG